MKEEVIQRIAKRIVAEQTYHFESVWLGLKTLLSWADKCLEKNSGNDVPAPIRELSSQICGKAHEMEKMFENENLKPCLKLLKEICDMSSRHCNMWLEEVRGANSYYENQVMDKHYCPYIDGTNFEMKMKQEIEWREKDAWKSTYDFNGACEKVFNVIKSMMNPYSHAQTNLIDLSPFGIPNGWNFLAVTCLDADKKTLLLETKTKNDVKGKNGGSVVYRNDTRYSDAKIREDVEWMIRIIEDKN